MYECDGLDVKIENENIKTENDCSSPFTFAKLASDFGHQRRHNSFIVPIDELENPTIDAVLNRVPLVYDAVTKQLLLSREYDLNSLNRRNDYQLSGNDVQNLEDDTFINDKLAESDDSHTKPALQDTIYLSFINGNCDNATPNTTASDLYYQKSALETNDFCAESHNDNVLSNNSDHSVNNFDAASSNESNLSSLSLKDFDVTNEKKFKKIFSLPFHNWLSKVKRKNSVNDITVSTTALILENRPSHLPAKDSEEELKHKQEYEEMVRAAKKKGAKDAKLKKKLLQKQWKEEEQVIAAIKLWTNEILPNWDNVKDQKKTQEHWWNGVPSSVREKVWVLAIANELNITEELFDICVERSKEKIWTLTSEKHGNESYADSIRLDVSRTFPQLGIFQEKGPYHEILRTVLGAYVVYRPDIGYVQGMSFLAGMLLLHMNPCDAFICFSNLLNSQLLLSFFRVRQDVMSAYYETFEEFFEDNLPKLHHHFKGHNLTPDLYLVDYIYTLFSRSLPLDVATRVWDLFLRDGNEFIFRTALGILSMYENILLNFDFIHLAQFLTKLPEDLESNELFVAIAKIRMVLGSEKRTFSNVLNSRLQCSR